MIKVNSMISGKTQVEIKSDKAQIKKEIFTLLITILSQNLMNINELKGLIEKLTIYKIV